MLLFAAPVVPLLFFSDFVAAGISAPGCSASWKWSFNSIGQTPCTIAAYMMATCSSGSFTVAPLPAGASYPGPTGTDDFDLCKCSAVGYSLLSACAGCQGETWINWSQYVANCTEIVLPPSFPNPIPPGTFVPQWALLDVTNENNWNSTKSRATGDSPEQGPGTLLGASSSSVSAPASTTTSSSTGTSTPVGSRPSPGGHSSNAGAIAGGIIGSIAVISILVAGLLFYLRRRRSLAPTVVFEGDGARHVDQVQFPMLDQGVLAETLPETIALPKPYVYNPDDPTTYPEYQTIQSPPAYVSDQIRSSSPNRSVFTLAAPQSPRTQRYRGLPIV